MRISLSIPELMAVTTHGYGVAAFGMVRTLQELGHEVPYKDPAAPVEISFAIPPLWEWSNPDAYHIGYLAWESTRIPQAWAEHLTTADEIWTTSPWVKTVVERSGFPVTQVYMHGVDTLSDNGWQRKHRRRAASEPLRFLHMGEPAPRKGGQMAYQAFRDIFAGREDVSLTIKAHGPHSVLGTYQDNISVIQDELSTGELVDLVNDHDILVYPSYGEGFGLIPLQAMVTGMPVICPDTWAPYRQHLNPALRLPSKLVPSPWPEIHPGNMYEPDLDALKWTLQVAADRDEFVRLAGAAYAQSFAVEQEFDWFRLTRDAFAHIVDNFGRG